MGTSIQIEDAPLGGSAIGHLTGAVTPLWIAHLPADPKSQRARVATSIGQGALPSCQSQASALGTARTPTQRATSSAWAFASRSDRCSSRTEACGPFSTGA